MILDKLYSFVEYVIGQRQKVFYPGFPFVLVPIAAICLIVMQLEGSLVLSPSAKVSALQLQSTVSSNGVVTEYSGTMLLIPAGVDSFTLPTSGGKVTDLRSSASAEELQWNQKRLALNNDSVVIDSNWIGVKYPLALLVDGHKIDKIRFREPVAEPIPQLELNTAESIWVTLGTVLAAVFGIGVAAGFLKDSDRVVQENPGGNVGH